MNKTASAVLEEQRRAEHPAPPVAEHSLVAVAFKDEGTAGGETIGPVWSRDRAGKLRPHQAGADGRPRWFTRTQALAIAEACGLDFEEV